MFKQQKGVKMNYFELIEKSKEETQSLGMDISKLTFHKSLAPHQLHGVKFALERGRSALFFDTGLGKSFCAFEWAKHINNHTKKPVLMLAPLGVVWQHREESIKWGFREIEVVESQSDVDDYIYVTNYDKLKHFCPDEFGGIVIDESSILKSFTGATTRSLIEFARSIPYRLALTATPAPNDHMELGQHSAFLGIMRSSEMLARWFIADQSSMGKYRLKKPAIKSFWAWVASWARAIESPSDLGFDGSRYKLPELKKHTHTLKSDVSINRGEEKDGQLRLLRIAETSATSIHSEKRLSADGRAKLISAEIEKEPNEPWIVWVDTDYEADAIMKLLPEAVEVRGSMTSSQKEKYLLGFSSGKYRILVTKPRIAGFGMNWQHCSRVAFVGLSFSYEQYYQAIRRCWRFGQTNCVHVHIAMADTEKTIFSTINRKSESHDVMKKEMKAAMKDAFEERVVKVDYQPKGKFDLPTFI